MKKQIDTRVEQAAQLAEWRNKKATEKATGVKGEFNLQEYLRNSLPEIARELVAIITSGKANTKAIELALKSLGELVEKREDMIKVYTNDDISRDSEQIIGRLKQLSEETGVCVLCGNTNILLAEVCDNQVN